MKTTKELLGARIKELRKTRGFSQERLAEMVGVEPKHLSRIEVGSSYPSLSRLELIANALGVPIKEFFDFMHLEDSGERAASIESMVKELEEGHQKLVYKIVRAFKE